MNTQDELGDFIYFQVVFMKDVFIVLADILYK